MSNKLKSKPFGPNFNLTPVSSMELELFVWEGEGVLKDYTNGLIVVLAHDIDEALELIYKKAGAKGDRYVVGSFPLEKYKVYKDPEAFYVHGGS